jgi:hypothetical protein
MRSSWMLFRGQDYSGGMCLEPVIRPERPAPKGKESLAQGLYVFSAGYLYGPKGQGNLAQGLPWEPNTPKRRALTRHMNVRSTKDTRSAGLEMLKGRQIESTCSEEVGSNCETWQLRTLILRNDRREIHRVSSHPFRANHSFWAFPGLKPWAESFSPFGAGPCDGDVPKALI